MVFHDRDLDRMTGHRGRVADLTAAEVQRLTLSDGEAIPTLSEVLEALPELRFNIDLKDEAGIEPVTRLIRSAEAIDRVCVTSFSERRAAAARRLLGPDACTGLGVWGVARFVLTGRTAGAAVLQMPFRARGIRVARGGVVRRAHRAGLPLHVWTLNDATSIEHALDLGVDGIMTDRPAVLKAVLEERGEWSSR